MSVDYKYQCEIEQLMQSIDAQNYNAVEPTVLICTGLTEDSRLVKQGDIFVARPGLESDGRRFIEKAIHNGAIAIICEETDIEKFILASQSTIAVYSVNKLADKLGILGSTFYQNPSKSLKIVGVTGTNGKTSCTQMMARCLHNMKNNVAVMGTLGNGRVDSLVETGTTTTGALTIQAQFADYLKEGIEIVFMEVSSHALNQGRVNSVEFDIALFTNLTRDHLDYHGDMDSYAKAKRILLTQDSLKTVIVNADDAMGTRLLSDEKVIAKKYSFSITPINARQDSNSAWTESVEFHDSGIEAEIATPWGAIHFKTSMIGQFNLSNCLAVITTLGVMGFEPVEVAEQLEFMSFVKGRMERFGGDDKPLVIVDFAHTPDAMKQVLKAIKPHTQHKLWCVFGCGGDRDRGKRSEMASIAEEYADYLVFTSDNPRSEPVEEIITEMLKGLSRSSSCIVEYDRELAIRNCISKSVIGDVILIAGKGHERFQHIGTEKIPHSDADIVNRALEVGNFS